MRPLVGDLVARPPRPRGSRRRPRSGRCGPPPPPRRARRRRGSAGRPAAPRPERRAARAARARAARSSRDRLPLARDGGGDRERLDVLADVVDAEDRGAALVRGDGGADEAAVVPTVPSRSPSTLASVLFLEIPTSTGRPSATRTSSRRSSSRFCAGVFPNPIPGSRQIRASAIPSETANASRSSRNAATSATTSSYLGSRCIVRGEPSMCIRQRSASEAATTPASSGSPRRAVTSLTSSTPSSSARRRPRPWPCRSRPAAPGAPPARGRHAAAPRRRDALRTGPRRLAADVDDRGALVEQAPRGRDRHLRLVVPAAVGEAVGRDVDDPHHARAAQTFLERRTSHRSWTLAPPASRGACARRC